ncbi:hypothetical protein [Sphingomonas adhaesiva]|uniref:hypothetical protein n=1 Tax=Sphingomonas adhaesiva TaxID=28212 RepID=UPI002FFC8EB5
MKAAIVAVAAALSLASCATTSPAAGAVDRLQAGYERVELAAERLIPLLPPERQTRARAYLATLGLAIDAARTASDAYERAAAIARAEAQLKALGSAMAR